MMGVDEIVEGRAILLGVYFKNQTWFCVSKTKKPSMKGGSRVDISYLRKFFEELLPADFILFSCFIKQVIEGRNDIKDILEVVYNVYKWDEEEFIRMLHRNYKVGEYYD